MYLTRTIGKSETHADLDLQLLVMTYVGSSLPLPASGTGCANNYKYYFIGI